MGITKFIVGLGLLALVGCSDGNGVGLPTGASNTHRGEADAVDPFRNVTIQNFCQNNAGEKSTDITVNNTNNCNKQNDNSSVASGE